MLKNKKVKILIITVVIVLLIGGIFYYYKDMIFNKLQIQARSVYGYSVTRP